MITQSYWKYTDTPMCNSKDMRKYLKMYMKDLDESKLPYLSLAEAPSLYRTAQCLYRDSRIGLSS